MESIKNIVAGVYVLLQGGIGRLTQNELDWNDVLEVGTDVMRGFMQDANLAHRDLHTAVSEVLLDLDSAGVDYRVTVPATPDFEPKALQYAVQAGGVSGWGDVNLVDLDAFPQYYTAPRLYGAFYGSTATPDGLKVRLNVGGDLGCYTWQMTYRLSLFTQLQMGARPPLPLDFMRMVKLAWAIACVPIVKVPPNKLGMWRDWKRETLQQYLGELQGWNNPVDPVNPGRWQEYLNGGKGSSTQAIPRFDDSRRNRRSGMRGVVGPGGTWGVRG